jgi:DNA-binding winged helix-turn-helix (wHTH) protein/tetratricopeptide (TPR) repeat protein
MIYTFDTDYELDLQRYELRCSGHVIKIEPQVFDVLVYLIQHRHRVVTKDELVEHVWAGRLVSKATLTSRMMAARRAVGDRGREQRVIQTLHGRGYRFIVAVEEHTVDGSTSEVERRSISRAARALEPIPLTPHPATPSSGTVVGRETEMEHMERGITLYDRQQHQTLTSLYGKELGVACRYWSALALWFLGYPDQALQKMQEALTLAQDLAHPYRMAMALDRASFLGQFRRENHATRQWAESAVGIAAEHGFRRHAALGPILRGWAQSVTGQAVEGIPQIRQGMNTYRELGMAMEEPYFLALLAEAQAREGLIEEGLATLAEALVALPSGRDFFYKAELYRLQGELLWQWSGSDERAVEDSFQQALDIARQQRAKSLELRAAMSLSRLWQHQGRRGEARQLLEAIYHQFTEGFSTPDLRAAKGIIETLV